MISYCIGSKERGDMTMMNRIRSRFGFTVCLLVLLIVALAVPASAANYSKLYGTTTDRLRLRESASSNATTIDNLAKDRCVYIIQSKDSGGITWIEVKYRTHEGGTETGWVAQTDGKTTFVKVLSVSQAKKLYNVSDGDLPSKPTGLWTAKERSAAQSSGSSSSGGSSGASSDNVKMAQSVLKDMGIYAGEITGNMGDKTVAAIKEFQKRYGLTRDGQLGPDTLSKLRSVGGSSASSGSSSSTSADAVKRAQGQLKELGIYSGEITGKVGSKTTAAIKEFQRRNGLTADGVLGPSTIARLDEVAGSGSSSSGVSSDTIKDVQAKLGNMGIYSGEVTGNLGSKTIAAIKEFQKRYNLTQDGIPGPATVTKLNQVYSNTSTVKVSSGGAGLGIGSSGTAVATLQQNLTTLGYYWAEITGNFGSKTQEAVKRFQKAYGLPQDGVAGEATLSAIKTQVSKKGGSSSSGSGGSINTSSILQLNSTGSNVTALQNKLAALGFYKGEITGHYGEKTRDAVKAFQSKNGLVADGIAGPATLRAISSAKSSGSGSSGSSSSGGSSGSSAVSSTTLTVGSTGAAVRSLQNNLTTLGYYSGDVTGHFGSQTAEAVRKYQKAKGLSQTGTATPSLQSRIASDTGSGSGSGSKVVIKTSLKQGDSGDAVRDLQNALYKLGFYNGTISGNYGSLTAAAVRKFQDKNDLTVDGIAGSRTIALINQKAGSSISPSSGSSGSSGNSGSGTTTLVSYARVSATSALLRTSASTSSKSKTTLKNGTQMKISKKTVTGGEIWYYVQAYQDGYTYIGYVRSDLVTIISAADFKAASEHNSGADDEVQGILEVRSSDVAVREGPGTTYEIMRRAQYGDIYTYIDTENGWYKLTDGYYINAAYVSTAVDQSKIDDTDTTSYRVGDTDPMVANIQEWLKKLKYYDGDVTGHYGNKTAEAVAAFQRDNSLTDDGIAGRKTLAALQAKIAGGSGGKVDYTGTIHSVNWFVAKSSEGNYGFSKIGFVANNYAKLTDLGTGISLRIKIQSTGNHIDAEPVTAADTAKFCSIYGVSYASSITSSKHYQRRPMMIEIEKTSFKAVCSMYGVPHGKQTILDNNFPGQFCLHFYNSKTSGSDKVDSGHQNAITRAETIVKNNGNTVVLVP